jgi:hypothetical protein
MSEDTYFENALDALLEEQWEHYNEMDDYEYLEG